MKAIIGIISAIIVLISVDVMADTTWITPTVITLAVHWTKANSPYIIQGGVGIQSRHHCLTPLNPFLP